MRHIVNSDGSLFALIGILRETFKTKKYFTVTLKFGKVRSVSQNAMAHAWYAQVAEELREDTAEEVKCKCKLHLGAPILFRDTDFEIKENGVSYNFYELYQTLITPLSYEDQLKAMVFFPVTRFFTTEQHALYLEGVQRNYAHKNVMLEYPEGGE